MQGGKRSALGCIAEKKSGTRRSRPAESEFP
jgi:hypothetical protein